MAPNPMMAESGNKVGLPGCHAPIRWTELRMTEPLQLKVIVIKEMKDLKLKKVKGGHS